MTGKTSPSSEFRMSASDFDGMMRGALGAAPATKPSPKKPAKRKFKKPDHLKMSDAEYDQHMLGMTAKTVAGLKKPSK